MTQNNNRPFQTAIPVSISTTNAKVINNTNSNNEVKTELRVNNNNNNHKLPNSEYYKNIISLFNTEECNPSKLKNNYANFINYINYKPLNNNKNMNMTTHPSHLNQSGLSKLKKNYFNKAQKIKRSLIDPNEIKRGANTKFEVGVRITDYNKYKNRTNNYIKSLSRDYKSTENSLPNRSKNNENTDEEIEQRTNSQEKDDKRLLINLKKKHFKNKSNDCRTPRTPHPNSNVNEKEINNSSYIHINNLPNQTSNNFSNALNNFNNSVNIFKDFKKYKDNLKLKDFTKTLSSKNQGENDLSIILNNKLFYSEGGN